MVLDTLSRWARSEAGTMGEGEVFDLLKEVGHGLTSILGKSCEVLIHDLSDLEHSIVWIEGDVTGRKIGGVMSDYGLERLRKGETDSLFNYTTYTETGKTLKSSSIWIRDSEGEIHAAFCVNLDVTAIDMLHDLIRDLAPGPSKPELSEAFPRDLRELVETLIAEAEYQIGTPAGAMTKDQRMDLVRFLENRGAFQVRNSVAVVASALGVTRKTIYNYLGEEVPDSASSSSGE